MSCSKSGVLEPLLPATQTGVNFRMPKCQAHVRVAVAEVVLEAIAAAVEVTVAVAVAIAVREVGLSLAWMLVAVREAGLGLA